MKKSETVQKSVMTALKNVMTQQGIVPNAALSDSRMPRKGVQAAGVKFRFQDFDETTVKKIIEAMEARNFEFHYYRRNSNGFRFCFSKK